MILARPLFGTLDIALFAITLTLIAFFVVKKNWCFFCCEEKLAHVARPDTWVVGKQKK